MFFDKLEQIPSLSEKTNFSIFVLDDFRELEKLYKLFPNNTLVLKPDEKNAKISVEKIREFTARANSRETKKRFFIVERAETMNEAAENAFLKNLEEPKENNYFLLFVKDLSALLPTVRSRASVYIKKVHNPLEKPVEADEKVKLLAKQLIVAKPTDLTKLATEISAKKDNSRKFALEVVGAAIEILYKSFFATKTEKLLKKLPNLIELYSNLAANGHLKLHFVADML